MVIYILAVDALDNLIVDGIVFEDEDVVEDVENEDNVGEMFFHVQAQIILVSVSNLRVCSQTSQIIR